MPEKPNTKQAEQNALKRASDTYKASGSDPGASIKGYELVSLEGGDHKLETTSSCCKIGRRDSREDFLNSRYPSNVEAFGLSVRSQGRLLARR